MEIEAKFRVETAETFAEVADLPRVGRFTLEAGESEQQRNTYYDTADGRLRDRRFGLRVRDLGDRRIATLKGQARVSDGTFERDEWETEVPDDAPEHWPAGELRDRVRDLTAGRPIQAILTIETMRRHIYAAHEGRRFAEISLDDGTIHAAGRAERFRELEIELLPGGAREDFDSLVRMLRERFRLVPEERSKLERGLALLEQRTPPHEAAP